jgi:Acetyltransferase (GNAT) family
MTYQLPEISIATPDHIEGILALQDINQIDRGGSLSVRFPRPFLEAAIDDLPVIVACRSDDVVGYLLSTSFAAQAHVPLVQLMLRSYASAPGAYICGPICVAESERGRGLAGKMDDALRQIMPGRERVSFARRDNTPSINTHLKMGYRPVGTFTHNDVAYVTLSFAT